MFETDILVTFNDPVYVKLTQIKLFVEYFRLYLSLHCCFFYLSPMSSSYSETDQIQKWTLEDFMKTIQTFSVINFGLFGAE